MARRFPLEMPRAEPDRRLPIGFLALDALLQLACASDQRFAGVHRLLERRER
jgi:hypothetical protein